MTANLVLKLQPTCKMTQNLETPDVGIVSCGSSYRVKQLHAPEADWRKRTVKKRMILGAQMNTCTYYLSTICEQLHLYG